MCLLYLVDHDDGVLGEVGIVRDVADHLVVCQELHEEGAGGRTRFPSNFVSYFSLLSPVVGIPFLLYSFG